MGFVISFFIFWGGGNNLSFTLTENLKNIGVNSPNFAIFLRGKVYQIEKKILVVIGKNQMKFEKEERKTVQYLPI